MDVDIYTCADADLIPLHMTNKQADSPHPLGLYSPHHKRRVMLSLDNSKKEKKRWSH